MIHQLRNTEKKQYESPYHFAIFVRVKKIAVIFHVIMILYSEI